MPDPITPTPYPDVNIVLQFFLINIQSLLGQTLRGMYVTGSLALGDFNPDSSDIDFVVVTTAPISDEQIEALRAMHEHFAASSSPWATKIEATYIPEATLRPATRPPGLYPQVETDRGFFVEELEPGWVIQCFTLRNQGIAVAGPPPALLIDPVDPDEMRRASAAIAKTWLEQARGDPKWLAWMRSSRSFVVLTLCRLLYTLELGAVASKPAAARWAQQTLPPRWTNLIAYITNNQDKHDYTEDQAVNEILAFIQYTVNRFQQ